MTAAVARQLGEPRGLAGRLVARMLNRSNRRTVTAAVEAMAAGPGGMVADAGFGGGFGLALLLQRVGATGQVHGVEVSSTMRSRARRRFRREAADGRLHVHAASLAQLPFADASLDGLMTINTIYFVPELERAFAEIARVLKPDGRGVVGLADPAAMAKMPVTAHGFLLRPVPVVLAALQRCGLTLLEHRRVGVGEDAAHLLVTAPARPAF